jgi:trehalose/maltose transport system substrate-binding protein
MTPTRRSTPLVAAFVCSALVLAGCGSAGGTAKSPTVPGEFTGRGPIKYVAGKDATGTVQGRIDRWNEAHPDEKVSLIELPPDVDAQRQQLIQNAQIKSDAFTVISLDAVWTSEFAANRWVERLPEDEFPLDRMLDPVVETVTYRGGLYAVPETSDGAMLYFRRDLLRKAGVDRAPRTWAAMKEACGKVLELPEARGMSCYSGQFEKYEGLTVNFAEAVHSAGGVITDEKSKPRVNTPEAKKGLDFLVDSFREGLIAPEAVTYKEEETRQAFQKGRTVFMRQWAYAYGLMNQKSGSKVAGKFAVAPLPGLDGPGSSSLGGHNLALSPSAKNKATAIDFMKFFSSEASARRILSTTPAAPTYASIYDDPELVEKNPYLPTLKESIERAVPRPRVVRYGDATRAVQDEVYAALTRRKSSGQALRDLQVTLSELVGE